MHKYALKKKNFILAEESALEQVMILLEYYDIDVESMQGDELKATESFIENLIEYIRLGYVEITEKDGCPMVKQFLQKTSDKATIKEFSYGVITGRAAVEMGKGGKDPYGQLYSLLAHLSDNQATTIKSVKGIDLKIAHCLGLLFKISCNG